MAKEIIKEDSLYIAKDRKKKIPSTVQYIKKDLIYIANEIIIEILLYIAKYIIKFEQTEQQ